MRRLVGLIALLALILGAAWLAQNDFDLRRVAVLGDVINKVLGPAGEAVRTDVASAPGNAGAGPTAGEPTPSAEAPTPETGATSDTESAEMGAKETAAPEAGMPAEAGSPTAESGSAANEAPAKMASAESSAPAAGPTAAQETPSGESQNAMAEPAPTTENGAPGSVGVVPSFDIVRVEPTGETVIAGIAAPQAKVEVLNGPDPVATAEANKRGEWALVLEKPLPPGNHSLAIRTTSPDKSKVTLSDQRVAVSIPKSADEEPLVVLSTPNAPSKIIQVPKEAEPSAGTEVAAAPQAQEGTTAAPSGSSDTTKVAAAPTGPSVPETDNTTAPKSGTTTEMPSPGETARAAASSQAESPAAPMGAPAAEPKVAAAPEPKSTAEPSALSVTTDVAATPPVTATGSSPMSETKTTAAKPETTASQPAPSVSAGSAKPPAGSPEVGSETMMAEAPAKTTNERAMPAKGPEAPAMAANEPAGPAASAQSEPEPPAAAQKPAAVAPKVGVAAVEAETNGALYIAGTATTHEPVRVYVDDDFVGEAKPTESGTWLVETKREMAPAEYTIRADQIDAGTGAVVARAEVPFEREIEVATLRPTGQMVGAGEGQASGSIAAPETIIIKRGDNLWRISRKMYGHGVRYSTIYQANRDQIRNPNLIYPGQVFVLPAGNANWKN